MLPVSALLITKNEELYIERALRSLLWCDEIVVIDAFSTDATPTLCQNANAPWAKKMRFIQNAWLGFSAQRNLAMEKATHDWVLFLDGDESCSPELAKKIQELLAAAEKSTAEPCQFKIRRQEFFLKKPIHYSIWNPSYHIRFFNKKGVRYIYEVHEGVQSQWKTESIEEPIVHVEDLRIERFLNKLNHYTTLQAQDDYQKGKRTSYFKIFAAFPAMFYKNYIYYRGYKDGKEGLIISVLEGLSRTVRHLKLWQIEKLNS